MRIKIKHKFSKKTIILSIVTFVTLLSVILYALADRYLIEHIEKNITASKIAKATSLADTANEKALTDATYDDWNYKSSDISINIQKVQSGSGRDMITYFVADVVLNNSSDLSTAFAKNQFGRNITEQTSKIAKDNNAILAINGDYYGFRDDGVLIRNSVLYRDTPTRVSAALLSDGRMEIFDETKTSSSELLSRGVTQTFSFGPALVTDSSVVNNAGKISIDSNFGNRSIQSSNPRTGIGMISSNHYVFVVVDGRSNNYSRGMTLSEFSELFLQLGCQEAYNLDGGGSSTMYFMGRVVNNPLGKQAEREISDIIYIKE